MSTGDAADGGGMDDVTQEPRAGVGALSDDALAREIRADARAERMLVVVAALAALAATSVALLRWFGA